MKTITTPLAVTLAWLLGVVTHAAEPHHTSATVRRPTMVQISQCMKKRMSADRSITYNDAMKACEALIIARKPTASGELLASAAIRRSSDRNDFTESKQGRTIR